MVGTLCLAGTNAFSRYSAGLSKISEVSVYFGKEGLNETESIVVRAGKRMVYRMMTRAAYRMLHPNAPMNSRMMSKMPARFSRITRRVESLISKLLRSSKPPRQFQIAD